MAQAHKNINNFSYTKYLVVVILFVLICINLVYSVFFGYKLTNLKSQSISMSRGSSYNATLNLWVLFVENQDWDNANFLEKYILPDDISKYKRLYHPNFLELKAQNISQKPNLNIEDYMELSKIYTQLGQYQNATDALGKARQIDLLRTDIEKLSFLFQP